MLDPISDMLTRIRNAQRAGHSEVEFPASKLKMAVARILESEKFIRKVEKFKKGNFDYIRIVLKYSDKSAPTISEIKRISKEGQRMYIGKNDIHKIKSGFGISIISTSKGVVTGSKARELGVGGEIICEVW